MYIKNPNKKESYSFRIYPELLEKIKLYAKATNQTVPEILNDMIKNKVNNLHLTNDYLPKTFKKNLIISIPPLDELSTENLDLLNNGNSANILEVKQIPNNLDVWTDKEGYKSNKPDLKHEGIEFVLVPDLILKAGYHIIELDGLLEYCLIPIYFRITKDNTLIISNIHMVTALNKIKASQNINLLDTAKFYEEIIRGIISKYTNKLNNATYNKSDNSYYAGGFTYINREELLKDLWGKCIIELDDIKGTINKNIVIYIDGAIERELKLENKENNSTVFSDNDYLLLEELKKKDKIINELKEELNEIKQTQKEIINDIDKRIEERILKNISDDDLDKLFK